MRRSTLALAIAFLIFTGTLSTDVLAAHNNVAAFYEGKQIKVLIGYGAGGGYDTYGRLLARHMSKHIPGNPDITVQNMPGAGSLKMINYLYNGAPNDGTVLGTGFRTIVTQHILNPDEFEYDPGKFSWIGSMNKELSVCVSWHDSPVKTFGDMLTQEFIVGMTGKGDSGRTFLPLLANLFGAQLKVIAGYSGSSEINLALERGEVDGRCGWSWSSIAAKHEAWVNEGKLNILLQLALEKHPDLPDVPLVLDLTEDPDIRRVIKTVFASNLMGRPFIAPPGVPAKRLEALQGAFAATLNDPEFLAEAGRMNIEIQLMTGKELQALVKSLVATSPEILELTRETIKDSSESAVVKPAN